MMDADEKSKEKIEKYQETKGYTDPSMLGAYMGMGQTQACRSAAATNSAGRSDRFCGRRHDGRTSAGRSQYRGPDGTGPEAGGSPGGSSRTGSGTAGGRLDLPGLRHREQRQLLHELRHRPSGSSRGQQLRQLRLRVPGSGESPEVLPELRHESTIIFQL